MRNININFQEAALISNEISDLAAKTQKVSKNNSLTDGLSSSHFSKTINSCSSLTNQINAISESISNLQNSFDKSVQSYYEEENISNDNARKIDVSLNSKNMGNNDEYTWGYKCEAKSISKIDSNTIAMLLSKRGAKLNGNMYEITIKGKTYRYNADTGMMVSSDNKKFYCCFYATNNSQSTMKFNNSITILATGKGGTHISADCIDPSRNVVCDNTLIITPYTTNKNPNTGNTENIGASSVAASTLLGDYLFDIPADGTRSIVGFSAGSAVTTRTVAANPKLYDNVVFVNGSTHSMAGGAILKDNNYSAFKDTNVYYLETEKGWFSSTATGRNKQIGVTNSINALTKAGVPSSSITLVTNDKVLASSANKNINISTSMPNTCSDGKLYGHSPWRVFNNSNILAFLSNK